jgi:phospholipase/carboxylesterase
LLLKPGVLSGAILLRAMVPLTPEKLPQLDGTRVFLASGLSDPILPIGNARTLAGMLRDAGADLTFQEIPTGHQLTSVDVDGARAWFNTPPR